SVIDDFIGQFRCPVPNISSLGAMANGSFAPGTVLRCVLRQGRGGAGGNRIRRAGRPGGTRGRGVGARQGSSIPSGMDLRKRSLPDRLGTGRGTRAESERRRAEERCPVAPTSDVSVSLLAAK